MDSDFSHRDPSSRRTQLFQSLSRLTPPEFGQLLYGIQPPAGLIPDSEAPQMKRVKALLDWAEGPTGRGTDEIWDALAQLQQGSLSSQGQALPNFQPYLQSILENKDYREWQECYTPTTVEGRKQAPQPERSRRLKLRVETVVAKDDSASGASAKPSEGEPQEKIEQFEVLEGLRQYAADHVLLIGKPGSGKSSSLEWLLWNEAGRALDDPTAKIPVLVKLRRCTSTLEALIQDFLNGHGLPLSLPEVEALLNQGKLLLLLDGLNELPANLGTEMANFRSRYRKTTPMVVSTREQSIGGTLGIAKTLKMLPLSEPQMQEFVQGYLGDEGKALFQQIKGDHLRKFAETPLLLWMLCRVFAQNGHVPSNLGMAFREFTQLYDRQIQEDAPAESRDQWPKLLRHLAFALMHDKELVDFRLSMPREEAENVLTIYLQQEGRTNARENAERWLRDLLDYHLIQPVIKENLEEHIEFRHQLIQEYYAAEHLLRLLPELSGEQLKRDYLNLLKWTEPIALMLALVDEENEALHVVKLAMDEVDLMLGARLAGEVKSSLQSQTVVWINALEIPTSLKIHCWVASRSEATIFDLLKTLDDQDALIRRSAVEALSQMKSESAIFRLLNALDDQDSLVRRKAFEALGKFGCKMTISGLLNALDHQDVDVRWRAAEALGQIGSDAAIPGLLKALEHQNSDVRRSAATALIQMGSDAAIPGLLKILEHQDADVWRRAVEALGRIGSDAAIPGLLEALEHQDVDVCSRAAAALGQLGSNEAIPGLLKSLEHQDLNVRRSAVTALGQLGNEATLPGLLEALEHQDLGVRWRAATALGQLGNDEAIPGLLEALEYKDQGLDVSWRAATALIQLRSDVAIPGLLKALEHQSSEVRMVAVYALGKMGGEATISGLIKALDHQNSDVCRNAIKALGQIGSEATIPGLIKALDHQDFEIRKDAVEALSQLGSEATIPDLMNALDDQFSDVRRSAVEALGKLRREAAIPYLMAALDDQDSSVRKNAITALGQLGCEAAITGLLKAINDRDPLVRWSAVGTMGQLGDEAVLPGLLKALNDREPFVRRKAAEVLGKLRSDEAIPTLLKFLDDQDSLVRWQAAIALGQLGSDAAIPTLLKAFDSQDVDIRRKSVEVLGNISCETTIRAIDQIARTRGPDLRKIAIEALGRLAGEPTISPLTKALVFTTLINALRDKYVAVRRNVVEAFGKIGSPKSISILWKQQSTLINIDTYLAISVIQSHCKFYNYEIWQEAMTAKNMVKEPQGAKTEAVSNIVGPNAAKIQIFERVEHYHENPPGSGQ